VALIIEDDVDLADIFSDALQAAQFKTEIIADGAAAQRRLQEMVPQLVVLDLHLPHVSGETLLRQIRSTPALAKVKVVIASADPITADMLSPESDLVLVKPVSFSQLRDLAQRLKATL
jgi:two-component system phosphate regulon response regulator PhoB